MISRFPQAYDPQMYQEERLALSRTASLQSHNASSKANGKAAPSAAMTPEQPSANRPSHNSRRKHFVLADPVAFRSVPENPIIPYTTNLFFYS